VQVFKSLCFSQKIRSFQDFSIGLSVAIHKRFPNILGCLFRVFRPDYLALHIMLPFRNFCAISKSARLLVIFVKFLYRCTTNSLVQLYLRILWHTTNRFCWYECHVSTGKDKLVKHKQNCTFFPQNTLKSHIIWN